jgi:ferritin-like metal-binding protein YciE
MATSKSSSGGTGRGSGGNSKNSGSKGSNTSKLANNMETRGSEESFTKLFEDGLKDIYWVEKALTKAIPKMIKKATSEELVAALEEHLSITEEQVSKVEQVFEMIGKKPQAKPCAAMKGILEEAEETMKEFEGVVGDAAIICSAQKVEHYEIASYGSLAAFAKALNLDDAAVLLAEIMEEEKEADLKLSEVAETSVNAEAIMAGGEEEEEEEE